MNEYTLLALMKETIYLSFIVAMPMLVVGTLVGVVISIIQTATSIQDQSLSFIPKLLATIATLVAFGPWMLRVMMEFANRLLGSLQIYAR
ncbi:MAG TPA: flagellar biosynthetic protein FliQ [Candidatus Ozemobacteraceae bacterium]|nr:flagellar biosynthetic protein FliQ [Candidatus Ozemobacteraceae bacterium]